MTIDMTSFREPVMTIIGDPILRVTGGDFSKNRQTRYQIDNLVGGVVIPSTHEGSAACHHPLTMGCEIPATSLKKGHNNNRSHHAPSTTIAAPRAKVV